MRANGVQSRGLDNGLNDVVNAIVQMGQHSIVILSDISLQLLQFWNPKLVTELEEQKMTNHSFEYKYITSWVELDVATVATFNTH